MQTTRQRSKGTPCFPNPPWPLAAISATPAGDDLSLARKSNPPVRSRSLMAPIFISSKRPQHVHPSSKARAGYTIDIRPSIATQASEWRLGHFTSSDMILVKMADQRDNTSSHAAHASFGG